MNFYINRIFWFIILWTLNITIPNYLGSQEREFNEEEKTKLKETNIIRVSVKSNTWRISGRPFDIKTTVKENLELVGFKVASEDTPSYDASLFIEYEEIKGQGYSKGFVLMTSHTSVVGYGTNITCNIKFVHKTIGLIFDKTIQSLTAKSVDTYGSISDVDNFLYNNALNNFRSNIYFRYLSNLILAAKLDELGSDFFKDGTPKNALSGLEVRNLTQEVIQSFAPRKINGVIVEQLAPNSPASRKGLRIGDIIAEINHQEINDPADFLRWKSAHDQQEVAVILITRKERSLFIAVKP